MVEAFQKLGQIDPQRYNEALSTLQRVAHVESAVIQNEQRAAQAQRQNFEKYASEHDQAFQKRIGNQTPQQKQAIGQELLNYAKEFGLDRGTLVHLLQNNPIMRHSAFQHMLHTAVEARLAKKAVSNYRNKAAPVPHVNKPGHGGAVASRGQSDLAALNAALNKSNSVADAAKLLIARRKGR